MRLLKGSSGVVKVTRGLGQLGYSLPKKPWLVVAWKELVEALRDRRTMINVVLLPAIMMPIFLALPMLMVSPKTVPPKIMVSVQDPQAVEFLNYLRDIKDVNLTIKLESVNVTDLIINQGYDLVVEVPFGFYGNVSSGRSGVITYYYNPYQVRSTMAISLVQEAVNKYSEEILSERLKRVNLTKQYIQPIQSVSVQVTAEGGQVSPAEVMAATIIPLMVGVIAITGAGTFAIDMIAGERERKTIEALLTAPVTRLEILFGKFATLTLLSFLSGLSTMVASIAGVILMTSPMMTSFVPNSEQISLNIIKPEQLPIFVSGVLLTVVLGGLTGNAVMVVAASLAKSFKEAQQYVGFLVMILMVPMIAVPYVPQTFYWLMRMLPIASLAMLARDLIVNPNWANIAVSLSFTLLYLAAFLVLSSKMFDRESLVFG